MLLLEGLCCSLLRHFCIFVFSIRAQIHKFWSEPVSPLLALQQGAAQSFSLLLSKQAGALLGACLQTSQWNQASEVTRRLPNLLDVRATCNRAHQFFNSDESLHKLGCRAMSVFCGWPEPCPSLLSNCLSAVSRRLRRSEGSFICARCCSGQTVVEIYKQDG